jgi:putative two-component system response regulator
MSSESSSILNAKILIVDDLEMNIRILQDILHKAGYKNITTTTKPTEAVKLYHEIKPDLLVLDLNMPEMDGFQVMEELQKQNNDDYLPILVLSNEESQDIKFKALESGAKDFLNQPYDRIEVSKRIKNLIEVRMLHMEVRDQNHILEEKVKSRTKELYDTQIDVIQRLARAIEYRDSETGMHIIRMSNYSSCLAANAEMSMEDCELILTASPLHDIGKIGISDSILRKPGKLSAEEWVIMRTHTTIGAELLSGSNSRFLEVAKEIALTHHEKWDGSGYPNGLKGEEIPLIGRICGICDVFDALTTKRPYKEAWTWDETVAEIKAQRGKHFDPNLLDCFISILPKLKNIQEKYIDPQEQFETLD